MSKMDLVNMLNRKIMHNVYFERLRKNYALFKSFIDNSKADHKGLFRVFSRICLARYKVDSDNKYVFAFHVRRTWLASV